jgi:hypothetical protein
MVFSSNEKRDREFIRFQVALLEWAQSEEFFGQGAVSNIVDCGNETFKV